MWRTQKVSYSASTGEKTLTNATTWLNHENITSGEPSQSSKAQILEFYLYEISRIIKLLRTERRKAVPGVGVWGHRDVFNSYSSSLGTTALEAGAGAQHERS